MVSSSKSGSNPMARIKRWYGCYDDGWKGVITSESFAHPAKFSKALVERILDYMVEKGWIQQGADMGDTFGGVATGGILAAYRGFRWVGEELEVNFVRMGNDNITLHADRLRRLGLPVPVLVQGDSRRFDAAVDAVVTSPPYVSGGHHTDVMEGGNKNKRGQGELKGYGKTTGQIG